MKESDKQSYNLGEKFKKRLLDYEAPFNEDDWLKMKKQLEIVKNKTSYTTIINRPKLIKVMSIAASFIILFASIWYIYFKHPAENQVMIASHENKIESILLSDSSVVDLNKNSFIEFPEKFASAKRNLKLTGEAFFQVIKDSLKPFSVETENLLITVKGTSFNVNAYPDENCEKVIVLTGLVEVKIKSDKNAVLLLKAGQSSLLNKQNNTLEMAEIIDINSLVWKTDQFVFSSTPFANVIQTLEIHYNCHIEYPEDMSIIKINGKFTKEGIEEILEVFCLTLNLSLEKEGYIFKLKKKINEQQ
jgi:ferric-dicitrate binding protein FerR (iron transport regulator)